LVGFYFDKILLAFPIVPDGHLSNDFQNSEVTSLPSVLSSFLAILEPVYATLTASSSFFTPSPSSFSFGNPKGFYYVFPL
jgi:hypothetical protein